MKKCLYLLTVLIVISGCATRDTYVRPMKKLQKQIAEEDEQYRIKNSREARLGSIGLIMQSDEPQGYQRQKLQVLEGGEVAVENTIIYNLDKINENLKSKISLDINNFLGLSNTENTLLNEKIIIAETMISDLYQLTKELRALIKQDPDLKKLLIDPNIRIITKVMTIHKYENSMNFAFSRVLESTLFDNLNTKVDTETNKSGADKLVYDGGPIIAYVYSKICWDENGSLRSLIIDNINVEENCPFESTTVSPDLPKSKLFKR